MNVFVWTANLLGWPAIHLAVGRTILSRPAREFEQNSWLSREYRWERGGLLYRRLFAVHRWKRRLPDGAPWLGGMPKKRIKSSSREYLEFFLVETRRAEVAHWCMLLCTPIFFFWNPPWACAVMAMYGLAANLPCILAQRANRIQLSRILLQMRRSEARSNPGNSRAMAALESGQGHI